MTEPAPTVSEADIVPFPAETAERYRQAGTWGDLAIAQEFRLVAAAHPDAAAVTTLEEELTYAELDARSDRVALGLHRAGLRPGERVLFQLTNLPMAAVAWYGTLKAGLVPVATLPAHREHEIVEIARQAKPAAHLIQVDFPGQDLVALARLAAREQQSLRAMLTVNGPADGGVALEALAEEGDAAEARAHVDAVQAGIDSGSLAVLQLSGGTTSIPKLIPRLHHEYWYNSTQYARSVGLREGDCVLHLLPLVHNAGIVCGLHAAHAVGGSLAMCAYDPEQITRLVARRAPTHMFMAPPIARMVLDDPALREALTVLRVVVWTLGKLPLDVRETYETATCRIQQLYGQGEGLCMVTPADAPKEVRFETVGLPISALDDVRIYRPGTEDPVDPGEPGELCCRGPYTVRGYFRGGSRNAEAFTSDGFYRSGDIAVEVPGPGGPYYAIEDRLKDLINRGGEKINALEVEELLVRHPSIAAAALVAMSDERLGERACAVLVLAPDADPVGVEDLRVLLDGLGVAKFKWPERVEIRDALPLTNVNKVNKAKLREEVAKRIAAEL